MFAILLVQNSVFNMHEQEDSWPLCKDVSACLAFEVYVL